MARRTRKGYILVWGLLFVLLISNIILAVSTVNMKNEIKELKAAKKVTETQVGEIGLTAENMIQALDERLASVEEKQAEPEVRDILALTAGEKNMVWGEVNGVEKSWLEELKVETTYPIVLYQVIGKNNEVRQNSYFEAEEIGEVNSFLIPDVTKEVTEIRLSGYDLQGNQWASQTYEIIFLD